MCVCVLWLLLLFSRSVKLHSFTKERERARVCMCEQCGIPSKLILVTYFLKASYRFTSCRKIVCGRWVWWYLMSVLSRGVRPCRGSVDSSRPDVCPAQWGQSGGLLWTGVRCRRLWWPEETGIRYYCTLLTPLYLSRYSSVKGWRKTFNIFFHHIPINNYLPVQANTSHAIFFRIPLPVWYLSIVYSFKVGLHRTVE